MSFLDKIKKKTKGFLKEEQTEKSQERREGKAQSEKKTDKKPKPLKKDVKKKTETTQKKEKKELSKEPNKAEKKEKEKTELPIKGIKDIHNIIIKPVINEKTKKMENLRKYTFEVGVNVNKIQISNAIEKIYKVKPKKVNIINIKGKKVRFGRIISKHKDKKRAVVTLKKNDKLDYFKPQYK
jgi:large subunit ribosomal protein L23